MLLETFFSREFSRQLYFVVGSDFCVTLKSGATSISHVVV